MSASHSAIPSDEDPVPPTENRGLISGESRAEDTSSTPWLTCSGLTRFFVGIALGLVAGILLSDSRIQKEISWNHPILSAPAAASHHQAARPNITSICPPQTPWPKHLVERNFSNYPDEILRLNGAKFDRPVYLPAKFLYPDNGNYRTGLVFDAYFTTPLQLVVLAWRPPIKTDWRQDVKVVVISDEGEDVVTGRFFEQGQEHYGDQSGRKMIYTLRKYIGVNNEVRVTFANKTETFYNLSLTYHINHTMEAVHLTLFQYDSNLLPIAYDYYKKQGFTKFIWAYSGGLTQDVLNQIPNHPDITVVDWDYDYHTFPDKKIGQQGHRAFIAWYIARILPYVEYAVYVDLDEFILAPSGVPVIDAIRAAPIKPIYTSKNIYAKVPDNWADWYRDYAAGMNPGPLSLRTSHRVYNCVDRAKTIYHRSFVQIYFPLVGPHVPEYCLTCSSFTPGNCETVDLIHYHITNFREGLSSKGGANEIDDNAPTRTIFD